MMVGTISYYLGGRQRLFLFAKALDMPGSNRPAKVRGSAEIHSVSWACGVPKNRGRRR